MVSRVIPMTTFNGGYSTHTYLCVCDIYVLIACVGKEVTLLWELGQSFNGDSIE